MLFWFITEEGGVDVESVRNKNGTAFFKEDCEVECCLTHELITKYISRILL